LSQTAWLAPLAAGPVHGIVRVPGSKSASARSLLLAALADGPSALTGVLDSRDTSLIRAGLAALGAQFEESDEHLHVTPATEIVGGGRIDCGLAGTVMRFLPPLAALAAQPTQFFGDPAASQRPMAPLLGALAELGAEVSQPHTLPFTVARGSLRGGAVSLDASGSSQFISALLLSGARFPDGITVTHSGDTLPSLPHIQMTVMLLNRRGVDATQTGPASWQVSPGPIAALDEAVEPDLTNAATLLAAAVVTGGELTTAWPDGVQAGDELASVLAAFGARLVYAATGDGTRTLTVSGIDGLRGADLDLSKVSELTPVAAALAALAPEPSTLRGVAHIRGHETDRLAALAIGLGELGANVRQTADGLAFEPAPLHGGVFGTHADHRLAHAAALVGLVTPGVLLDDVTCTTKTLPDFPGMWTALIGAER
jgi:3-phosphoshikimate 1-carboxyvinyltransferase